MASEIEYRHLCVTFSVAAAIAAQERLAGFNAEEKRYWPSLGDVPLFFVEQGSSNCTDFNNRPAKDWTLWYYGQDAMRQVIQASVFCEGGTTKMKGRHILPENYIKHYRQLKERAHQIDLRYSPLMQFELSPEFVTSKGGDEWHKRKLEQHPYTDHLLKTGALKIKEITRYGETWTSPVLTLGGDAEEKLAALEWVMSLAGHVDRNYKRLFSLHCHSLGSWCDDLVNNGQRGLFVA